MDAFTGTPSSPSRWAALNGVSASYLLDRFVQDSDAGDFGLALNRAILAAQGRTITCEPEKVYNFATSISNVFDFDIDLNGSILVAGTSGKIMDSALTKNNYLAGNYFNTVAGEDHFTIPAGVALVAGDWVKLESDQVFQVAGNYLFGEWIEIARVNAGIAYLRDPFLNTYRVDRIRVRKNKRQFIYNGQLDLTAAVAQTAGTASPVGLRLAARDIYVDLRVYGNDYVGTGVGTEAYNAEVGGFAHGITNIQALNDGTGSSRTGYGFSVEGRRARFFGQAVNCKHGFTCGSRTAIIQKIVFDHCAGSTPKGEHSVMDSAGISTKWQGILDVHAGCMEAEVIEPKLDGVNSLIMFRNKKMIIRGGDFMSRGVTTTFGQDGLIYLGETDDQILKLDGPIVAKADRTTAGLAIPSLLLFYGVFGNQKFTVQGRDIEGDNLRLATTKVVNGTANTISFGDLQFSNLTGTWIGGPLIGGDAAVRIIGAVGNISIHYGPDFKIDTPNYQRQPIAAIQHFASLGKVNLTGNADASLLSNSFNACHIGRDLSGNVCSGVLTDIDTTGLRLKAYRIGLDIASSSATAMNKMNFNSSEITYGLAGLEFGAAGNTTTAGRAVRTQLTTAPKRKTTTQGAAFLTGSTVQALCIEFAGGVRNDDISGLTTNDALPTVSGTYFYVPTGIRLVGANEDQLWRSSTVSFYLNRKGHLTADGLPTNGNANGIQNGTIAKARVPTAGGAAGYVLISGSTWKAEANLAA